MKYEYIIIRVLYKSWHYSLQLELMSLNSYKVHFISALYQIYEKLLFLDIYFAQNTLLLELLTAQNSLNIFEFQVVGKSKM